MISLVLVVTLGLGAVAITRESQSSAEGESPWTTATGGLEVARDVDVLSPTEVWAVGSSLARYDGQLWRVVDQEEVSGGWNAIDLVAPGEGWAVGEERAVPIRGGLPGPPVELPAISLQGLALEDAATGWAVGLTGVGWGEHDGVIFRLSGGIWQMDHRFTGRSLFGIWLAGPGQAWAVGESGLTAALDAGGWHEVPAVTRYPLLAVSGSDRDDIWAVGGRDADFNGRGAHGVLLHYDGNSWKLVAEQDREAWADVAFDTGHGFLAGALGTIMTLDAGTWRELPKRVPAWDYQPVNALALLPGLAEAWVAVDDGLVYRVTPDDVAPAKVNGDLTGVTFSDTGRGWAVGSRPALRYTEARWSDEPPDSLLNDANDVDVAAPNLAWAVGDGGLILRWDGAGWQREASPTTMALQRVRAVSPTLAWAIGNDETRSFPTATPRRSGAPGSPSAPSGDGPGCHSVLLRFDGHAWETVWDRTGGSEVCVYDVDGSTADSVWLASHHGVWRWQDGTWTEARISSTDSQPSVAVGVVSPRSVWLTHGYGLFHWNGSCWRAQTYLGRGLTRMRVAPDGTGWAVGYNGYVLHLDQEQWRIVRGPADWLAHGVPQSLFGVALSGPPGDEMLWAVGSDRTILRSPMVEAARRPAVTPQPTTAVPPLPPWYSTATPSASPPAGSVPAAFCAPAARAFLPAVDR
jgi:hypothetical protein